MKWFNTLQITVTIPITLVAAKKDGFYLYKKNTEHKFSVTVTTFQDDVFYPMEVISPNDVVVYEGDVNRGQFELNEAATTRIQIFEVWKFWVYYFL